MMCPAGKRLSTLYSSCHASPNLSGHPVPPCPASTGSGNDSWEFTGRYLRPISHFTLRRFGSRLSKAPALARFKATSSRTPVRSRKSPMLLKAPCFALPASIALAEASPVPAHSETPVG